MHPAFLADPCKKVPCLNWCSTHTHTRICIYIYIRIYVYIHIHVLDILEVMLDIRLIYADCTGEQRKTHCQGDAWNDMFLGRWDCWDLSASLPPPSLLPSSLPPPSSLTRTLSLSLPLPLSLSLTLKRICWDDMGRCLRGPYTSAAFHPVVRTWAMFLHERSMQVIIH